MSEAECIPVFQAVYEELKQVQHMNKAVHRGHDKTKLQHFIDDTVNRMAQHLIKDADGNALTGTHIELHKIGEQAAAKAVNLERADDKLTTGLQSWPSLGLYKARDTPPHPIANIHITCHSRGEATCGSRRRHRGKVSWLQHSVRENSAKDQNTLPLLLNGLFKDAAKRSKDDTKRKQEEKLIFIEECLL